MTKNAVKKNIVVIMIMIMLGLAQADYPPTSRKLGCEAKCALLCTPLLISFFGYPVCYITCKRSCDKKNNKHTIDCITGCGLTKFIDINNDARDLTPYVMDSCLQKCQNN
ncbi:hypothetical protein CR513_04974, partial [Mucuna pruriens]